MTDLNVRARVEIAGEEFDSQRTPSLFSRVSVDLTTNQASEARISFFDPHFKLLDQFTRPDGPMLIIRVWLGYGDDLREPVFKGVLTGVKPGTHTTTFRAYDMSYVMRRVQKTGYARGTDLAIMRKLVTRNKTPQGRPLQFQGPAKGFPGAAANSTIHDQRTDWDFFSELAREAGLVVWVRDDTVFAAEPAKVGKPKLVLAYGADALLTREFEGEVKWPENEEGRPRVVEHRGRGRGGKRLTGKSAEGGTGRELVVIKKDLRKHTKAVAKRRADAKRELEREHAFQFSVRHVRPLRSGRVDVRDTLQITGWCQSLAGKYIVDAVSYEASSHGFETRYELYRDIKAA